MILSRNPTGRFSDRVENYIRYRPTYPKELISELKKEQLISEESVIADIGTVYAVEPNDEMREAAEKILGWYPNYISINGQAEATTLERRSIDLITVAQAFHWFNFEETKREFNRILKPKGSLVLVYNSRQIDRSPFMTEYDRMLKKFCPEYEGIAQQYINLKMAKDFFGTEEVTRFVCNNFQIFNFEGLKGRLLSSSYTPKEHQVGYQLLLDSLEALFEKHQENDQVQFTYETEMFYGKPVFPE
jgi:SAM-dependent methyltransferase